MAEKKMTQREFLENVINGNLTDEVLDFAADWKKKIEEKNAKRREQPSKTQLENAELAAKIHQFVLAADGAVTTTEIAANFDLSTQKIAPITNAMVKDGRLNETTVKVEGKGKRKAFTANPTEDEPTE